MGLKVIFEPGRHFIAPAGFLLTRVIYRKDRPHKKFLVVDAGMNDLIRPALYDAYHQILPVLKAKNAKAGRAQIVDIVGPICESGDFLAKQRLMPELREGEYLAVMGVGAYGFSMSSNYNSRRRAEEVLVVKDRPFVVRKRDSYADLIRNEEIPAFLLGL